jgi:PsbN protein
MESTTSLIVGIAAVIICFTAFAVYTAFGPPAKDLDDPYDLHED